jgi:hypothetical protein
MPSLVARRNCNATISSSPLQGVAPKGTQLTPIARASSSFCDRTLATPHRGHASSPSPAVTMSGPSSQSTEPLMPARMHKRKLGGPDLQRPAWSTCSATFPSNKLNEPAGFHTSSPRWKAPTPLLLALDAATLSLSRYHGDDF